MIANLVALPWRRRGPLLAGAAVLAVLGLLTFGLLSPGADKTVDSKLRGGKAALAPPSTSPSSIRARFPGGSHPCARPSPITNST